MKSWNRLSLLKFSREFVVRKPFSNDKIGLMSAWKRLDDKVISAWWLHQSAFFCFRRDKNGTEKPPCPRFHSLDWKLWRTYFCQEKLPLRYMKFWLLPHELLANNWVIRGQFTSIRVEENMNRQEWTTNYTSIHSAMRNEWLVAGDSMIQ